MASGTGTSTTAAGTSTSRRWPPRTVRLRVLTTAPSSRTPPASTRLATVLRGSSLSSDTTRSTRAPGQSGGHGHVQGGGGARRGRRCRRCRRRAHVRPLGAPQQHAGQDPAHDDAGVGHVERGPEMQRDEVDDRSVVGAHDPVGQVAERAAHDEPERHGEGRRLHTPHRPQHDDHGARRRRHRAPAPQPWAKLKAAPELYVSWKSSFHTTWMEPREKRSHGPRLGGLVDGHHHDGDGPGEQQAPQGVAPRTLPAAQRRCSPPLLQATHSRA